MRAPGSIRLYDPERRFDPTNDESAELVTFIGTRVQVVVAGVPAFTGRVDDVDHDLTTATLTMSDDVAVLAAIQFTETNVPAEVASARITRLLDLASWPATHRDITAGGVALQAGTGGLGCVVRVGGGHPQRVGGLVAQARWRPRMAAAGLRVGGRDPGHGRLGVRPRTPTSSPWPPAPIKSALVNVLAAARRGGTQRTVTDSASLTTYGRHSHVQNDLELASDGDRDLWQDFYLRRQATPARGVAGFTTRPGAAAIAEALGLPFGAIVRVVDEGHGPSH